MHEIRLTCSLFDVEVRLREFNGRWIASADTPDGLPTLGWGMSALGALWFALEPFGGLIDELLASLPDEVAVTLERS